MKVRKLAQSKTVLNLFIVIIVIIIIIIIIITRMHSSALCCVRSHSHSIWYMQGAPGHGKSWNLERPFSTPGKSWKIAKVMKSHGK